MNDPGVATHGVGHRPRPRPTTAAEEITSDGGTAVADRNSVIGDGADGDRRRTRSTSSARVDIVVNNAGISGGGAVRRDAGRVLRPARRHALRRRGAGEPCRVAAPQGVGRGPHRQHVVGVGVRHAVHQSRTCRARPGSSGSPAPSRRKAGTPGINANSVMPSAFTRMTAQLPDDDGFRTLPRDVLPARQGGAVRGVPRPREHVDHRRDLLGGRRPGRTGVPGRVPGSARRHARELRGPGRRAALRSKAGRSRRT